MLNSISQNIGSNMKFINSQFNEQVDKTISDAKSEIEAFAQHRMMSIVDKAIAENPDVFMLKEE